MPEFRWNPLLDTWTMVATNRQHRPHLPKDKCPFCPGSGKVPAKYEVIAYDNDFPVMSLKSNDQIPKALARFRRSKKNAIFRNAEAVGKCEVIIYSPHHKKQLYELSPAHILKIVELWSNRFTELSKD